MYYHPNPDNKMSIGFSTLDLKNIIFFQKASVPYNLIVINHG